MFFPASEVNPSEIVDKGLIGQLEEDTDLRIIKHAGRVQGSIEGKVLGVLNGIIGVCGRRIW